MFRPELTHSSGGEESGRNNALLHDHAGVARIHEDFGNFGKKLFKGCGVGNKDVQGIFSIFCFSVAFPAAFRGAQAVEQ